jgi:hypothetical protein
MAAMNDLLVFVELPPPSFIPDAFETIGGSGLLLLVLLLLLYDVGDVGMPLPERGLLL